MRKIKMEYLLSIYRNEIIKNDYSHVKDLIAIMVLFDLSYSFPIYEYYNLNIITLDYLMNNELNGKHIYKVGSYNDLNIIKLDYEKNLKKKKYEVGIDKQNAAITWIMYMLEFEFIKENDVIDLSNYRLTDFINDEKLIKVFDNNINTDDSINNTFNKVLKK